MLIGYDPLDGNKIKFINTDTRYLARMERILNRPMEVGDFWQNANHLVSLHIPDDALPDIDNYSRYCVQGGEVEPCDTEE